MVTHDGNISAAARAAGVDRMSIYKMMRQLGIAGADDKDGGGKDAGAAAGKNGNGRPSTVGSSGAVTVTDDPALDDDE